MVVGGSDDVVHRAGPIFIGEDALEHVVCCLVCQATFKPQLVRSLNDMIHNLEAFHVAGSRFFRTLPVHVPAIITPFRRVLGNVDWRVVGTSHIVVAVTAELKLPTK